MKKRYIVTVVCLALALLFTGCTSRGDTQSGQGQGDEIMEIEQSIQELSANIETGEIGDDIPVSRGLVARMIAQAIATQERINSIEIEIDFEDVKENMWYHPYVNFVFTEDIMRGDTEHNLFNPYDSITLVEAQYILQNLGTNIQLAITDENRDTPVSFALWNQLYLRALDEMSLEQSIGSYFGIWEREFVILATQSNNEGLINGNIITNQGRFIINGLNTDNLVDTQVRALVRGHHIVSILSVTDTSPTIPSVYVVSADDEGINIFSGGVQRRYGLGEGIDNTDIAGQIATIKIEDGTVTDLRVSSNKVAGNRIERITDNEIELSEMGRVVFGQNIPVYNIAGGNISFASTRDLLVGTQIAYFIEENNQIISAIITEIPALTDIRVALSTTGFTSQIHSSVSMRSTSGMVVRDGEIERVFGPNEIYTVDELNSDRAYVTSDDPIEITSIARQWGGGENPKYKGSIEIGREPNGFSVINVVPFEEYLMAVVPSEMPSSFGVDAAKIQAVTARSFAVNEFFSNRHASLGANVLDSVMSQVYNNIPANEISREAVEATRGEVLKFGDEIISANFFSTSAGVTANAGEVWARNNKLPAETEPFLRSVRQYRDDDFGDLSDEDKARAFFKETQMDAFDNNSPWFRWNVEMSANQIAGAINANLLSRYQANPFLIKRLSEDGRFRSEEVSTIGELVDISVIQRGEGGNIMELEVVGTQETIRILTEFNIRSLLAPMDHTGTDGAVVLNRWDDTSVNNFSMMPSSFFSMERLTDGNGDILYVRFIGGGFGHGAGMSQYGARGMLERGYSYKEVLEHFYSGARVEGM